jgi:hypothetical protein
MVLGVLDIKISTIPNTFLNLYIPTDILSYINNPIKARLTLAQYNICMCVENRGRGLVLSF